MGRQRGALYNLVYGRLFNVLGAAGEAKGTGLPSTPGRVPRATRRDPGGGLLGSRAAASGRQDWWQRRYTSELAPAGAVYLVLAYVRSILYTARARSRWSGMPRACIRLLDTGICSHTSFV